MVQSIPDIEKYDFCNTPKHLDPTTLRVQSLNTKSKHYKTLKRSVFVCVTLDTTLQGTNISHLGKRKIIFKIPFLGNLLVPWRVYLRIKASLLILMKHLENASGPEFHEDCWRVVQLWHGSTCGQGSEMFESHEFIGIESFVSQPKQPTKRNLPSNFNAIKLLHEFFDSFLIHSNTS